VQSVGKTLLDVRALPVHLVSLSAHKIHGPKGVGALYVRKKTRLAPILLGGTQERDIRAGTENVAGIIGFGVAADEATGDSDEFETRVLAEIPSARAIGKAAPRVCNTSSIGFERLESEAILILLSELGICASAGSACSSGSLEPSHVLQAMGIDAIIAHGAIRFSLSRFTTPAEIARTVAALKEVVSRLAPMSEACSR
jgi:cysteine desulfurase